MSNDEETVEETTEDENLEENEDVEVEEVDEEVIETEDEDVDEVDYKAELEKAEKTIQRRNKKIVKLKEQKKDKVEDEDEEEEEKSSEDSQYLIDLRDDAIEDAIDAVTASDAEAKLVLHHFTHTLKPTSFSKKEIIANVGYAKAIANQGKNQSKAKIIKKKTKSDKTAGSPAIAGSPPNKKTLKVTAYDKEQATKHFKGDIKKWMKYKD